MHRISRVAPALNQFPDRIETNVVYVLFLLLLLLFLFLLILTCEERKIRARKWLVGENTLLLNDEINIPRTGSLAM